jgi:hypothetical protein
MPGTGIMYRLSESSLGDTMTVAISLSILLLLIAAVSVLTRCASGDRNTEASYTSDLSFLESFSLGTYRPMLRLAARMDRDFLASIHGHTLAGCYRKIQRDLLREYLRDASRDFNRLYAIATAKAVQAKDDPGDLSMALLEQQMSFILLVWGLEARLILDRFLPFAFDLLPVIGQLEALASQTRELIAPQYSYQAL